MTARVRHDYRANGSIRRHHALVLFVLGALAAIAYIPDDLVNHVGQLGATVNLAGLPWFGVLAGLLPVVAFVGCRQISVLHLDGCDPYRITRDHLGLWPGLVAAASLLIGYVLVIVVCVSAAITNLAALLPSIEHYNIALPVGILLLLCLLHIRRQRVPTTAYILPCLLFTGSLLLILALGALRALPGSTLLLISSRRPSALDLLMLASVGVSSVIIIGISALPHNTRRQLQTVGPGRRVPLVTLGTLTIVITGLIWLLGAMPLPHEGALLLFNLARGVLGGTMVWYLFQAASIVLLVAAAYPPFSRAAQLVTMLANDQYLAMRSTTRQKRAVAQVTVTVCAAGLVVWFRGEYTNLITWYFDSTCLAFVLVQSSLVVAYWRRTGSIWHRNVLTHGAAASAGCIVFVLITALSVATTIGAVPIGTACLVGLLLLIHRRTTATRSPERS